VEFRHRAAIDGKRVLDVSYAGSASRRLPHLVDINQKLPKLQGSVVVDPTPHLLRIRRWRLSVACLITRASLTTTRCK